MNTKLWIRHLTIILLIIVMIFSESYFIKYVQNNYVGGFIPYVIITLFNIGIGLILGLEKFIQELKKEGSWKIDLSKIILMGIPSLYFSFGFFIAYNQYLTIISYPIKILFNTNTYFMNIFQVILGFFIITSFYKFQSNI
ncbi:MAG: hypothetical protein ACOWWR_08420 [Eubacteriales bacterium]